MPFSADETPRFDAAAIEKLRQVAGDQDKGFVAEMAQLFQDEATRSLSDLRVAADRGDFKVVTRFAHSLKSSAATLGFMKLSNACKALEIDTKNAASGPQTATLIATVLAEFELTIPILKGLS